MAVSLCLTGSMACIGRQTKGDDLTTEVGIDIGTLISRGAVGITVGRQFAGHWSIEGNHTLVFGMMLKGRSEEEEMHESFFSAESLSTIKQEAEDMISGGIRVRYWISEPYKGGYIMTGCRFGDSRGIDGTVGSGYAIRIWGGWRCSISFEIDIRRSFLQQSPQGNGLGITLSYTY